MPQSTVTAVRHSVTSFYQKMRAEGLLKPYLWYTLPGIELSSVPPGIYSGSDATGAPSPEPCSLRGWNPFGAKSLVRVQQKNTFLATIRWCPNLSSGARLSRTYEIYLPNIFNHLRKATIAAANLPATLGVER